MLICAHPYLTVSILSQVFTLIEKTYNVELCLSLLARRVQRDNLSPQQVLAGGDATGDLEIDPATVGDHAVDAPFAGAVEAVFADLEPLQARAGRGSCVVNLCEVEHGGAFEISCQYLE